MSSISVSGFESQSASDSNFAANEDLGRQLDSSCTGFLTSMWETCIEFLALVPAQLQPFWAFGK